MADTTMRISVYKKDGDLYAKASNAEGEDYIGPLVDKSDHVIIIEKKEMGLATDTKKLKKASKKAEQQLAQELGGKVQPASGAMGHSKGDIKIAGKFRIEHKLTQKKSYGLKTEELVKIASECRQGEKPVFVVEFQEPQTMKPLSRWAVVPLDDWKAANEKSLDNKGRIGPWRGGK